MDIMTPGLIHALPIKTMADVELLWKQAETREEKIAVLNDCLRIHGLGGKMLMTAGVYHLAEKTRKNLFCTMAMFGSEKGDFTDDNDPYYEHDFGALKLDGGKYYFKINYLDRWEYEQHGREYGSEAPEEIEKTFRVLTLMRSDEY